MPFKSTRSGKNAFVRRNLNKAQLHCRCSWIFFTGLPKHAESASDGQNRPDASGVSDQSFQERDFLTRALSGRAIIARFRGRPR